MYKFEMFLAKKTKSSELSSAKGKKMSSTASGTINVYRRDTILMHKEM
jgi:hypothetical protein